MELTSRLRRAAIATLPAHWQPAANYHYHRARRTLDPEIALLCGALGPGKRAVDVGANDGVYTHAFAMTGASVDAFEPQPACLSILYEYARRDARVRAHGVALGAQDSRATLHVPTRAGQTVSGHATLRPMTGAGAIHEVQVRTLDSFGLDHVAVLKVDVEGHELEVLRGGQATIRRWRPLLLLELEQRHLAVPIHTAFEEVTSLGYRGAFLGGGELQPLARFDPARHQDPKLADVPGAVYVNNFLFTPDEHAEAVQRA